MKLRVISSAMVVVGLGLAAACGGDDTDPASPNSESTLPPVDAPDGYVHPTGADEVVFSYTEVGGFTTREFAFQRTPNLLVSGDGRAFSPGAQIEIFPGPLLPAVQVQSITEDGIQQLLAAADEAGLLAEVDYEQPTNIADASTARVEITVDGETYVHEAYALGLGVPGEPSEETTPERQALADFIARLGDLPTLVGADNVGETELFEPEAYEIEAMPVEDLSVFGSDGIEPTVQEWPADASVGLADAAQCTTVPAAEVGEVLAQANQLTFFDDDGVTYQVFARPALPGSSC